MVYNWFIYIYTVYVLFLNMSDVIPTIAYNMREKHVHLWVIPGAAKNGQNSQN